MRGEDEDEDRGQGREDGEVAWVSVLPDVWGLVLQSRNATLVCEARKLRPMSAECQWDLRMACGGYAGVRMYTIAPHKNKNKYSPYGQFEKEVCQVTERIAT